MPIKIAIFGAGSIGCYIGGRLQAAGADVVLFGRERLARELKDHGLTLSDHEGRTLHAPDTRITTDLHEIEECQLVFVCVKSGDTQAAATSLHPHLPQNADIVSLQNGLDNAETLERILGRKVQRGMVAFNVAALGDGQFHQGTEGAVYAQPTTALHKAAARFASAGIELKLETDMRPVQWAKLMLNLNNAVNALANIPLRSQLETREFRQVLALAQDELLSLAAEAGLPPFAKLAALPPRFIPRVLRLPNWAFKLVAARMLAIDPLARSSMSDDLALGREPEVDWINGEVVRLAQSLEREAPVNARLTQLVHDAADSTERPSWSGADLLKDIQRQA